MRKWPLPNWGQIPVIGVRFQLILRSRPPWGLIFLVFRSKNGPQAVRLLRDFFFNRDTGFRQNFEFMYHKNARKPRPC